jgi:nickel/cobalt transporter (NicO) family protein
LPVTREASAQVVCRLVLVVMIAVLILITSGLVTSFADAWARAGPFGGSGGQPASGVAGWLLAKQATFYRALAGLIRAAKTNGSAYWGLMGISFVYGIFHAAGPGHGKAVISSYLLANEETWRRGVVLSFASALLQAATAVTIVAIAALLIGATAKMMGDTVRVIEIISYALITLVGVRLLWEKGRGFLRAVNEVRPESEVAAAAAVGAAAPLAADHLQAVGEVGSLCRHDHLEGDKHSHDDEAHEHGHDYTHAHDRAHGHDHAHGHPHEHAEEGDAFRVRTDSRVRSSAFGRLRGTVRFSQVAVTGVLAGRSAASYAPIVEALRLYVDRVNAAGGVNGKRIDLLVEDDLALPWKAGANARKLLTELSIA